MTIFQPSIGRDSTMSTQRPTIAEDHRRPGAQLVLRDAGIRRHAAVEREHQRDDDAGRDREAQRAPQEARHVAAAIRHEGEEERGDADREAVDHRQLARQERERQQHHAEEHRECGGVGGLREEEHRDALDVRDDLATLGDDAGQLREPAVEQHDARDRLGRGRSRVHRDADVGLLDRQRVVDAVARHRDRVAATLQRGDDVLLLRRRHPAEHDVLLERLAELVEVGRQLARVVVPTAASTPTSRAIAATVCGLSPEMMRTATPCAAKYSRVSLRVGSHALAEGQQGHGGERRGQAFGVGALVRELLGAVREHEGAAAGGGELGGLVAQVAARRGSVAIVVPTAASEPSPAPRCREDHLGAAEHPRARPREADRAPLARRRERDARLGLEHALHGIRLDEAARRGVRLGLGAVPGEHVGPAVGRMRGERHAPSSNTMSPSVSVPVLSRQMRSTRASPSTAGSSCTSTLRFASFTAPTANVMLVMSTRPSGIIATTDAIVATAASCHAPLSMASAHPPCGDHLRVQHQQADRADDPGHPAEHPVDRAAQLGCHERELLGLARELVRERVRADLVDHRGAASADHDRPREHRVIGRLVDRVGLAREHRLVELQALGCRRPRVRRDLVARSQHEQCRRARRRRCAISCSPPSRSTRACGACMRASLSSERFARNSCTEPMIVFAMALTPKSASCQRPMSSSTRKHAAMMPLKSVKTLARMMLHALRLVGLSNALVSPRAMRSATSAVLRPVALATLAPMPSSHHTRR